MSKQEKPQTTFSSLGLSNEVVAVTKHLGFTSPTAIQRNSIPHALHKKDVIGIAETGSGKTAAFLLPLLQQLLDAKERQREYFGLIIEPTRELAVQVVEVIEKMEGALSGLTACALVGGMDVVKQSILLAKKTTYYIFKKVKFFVIDEADKLLDMDFSKEIDQIIQALPSQRTTLLFSATMSSKVEKLERASLKHPVKVKEAEQKYATVDTLRQEYLLVPLKHRDAYLYTLLTTLAGKSILVFTMKCSGNTKLVLLLRQLGIPAIPLHGKMSQQKRLLALEKFKSGKRPVLVATDVASRGLDIPHVDVVINYDCPLEPKDYVHRVGRTARAGKSGLAVTLVTQYSVELYQRIEMMIEKKLKAYPINAELALSGVDRCNEAMRVVNQQIKEEKAKKKEKARKGIKDGEDEDD
ncbi:ATP-dependent rRNA helicase rrp3 [Entamoeba marina]